MRAMLRQSSAANLGAATSVCRWSGSEGDAPRAATRRARWMPGSDGFLRTQLEQASYPAETADAKTFVQMAIVYRGKQITVYRDGRLYVQYDVAQPQEFPRPDERFIGRPYRHAWTVQLQPDAHGEFLPGRQLIHHDLQAGTRQVHDFGAGRLVSEFVFVPRSADAPEGDGWLMGYVVDGPRQSSELVILDALDFSGEPVAAVAIPHAIPLGFHGNWMPDA